MASIDGIVTAYNSSGSPQEREGNPYDETAKLFDALTRGREDVRPSYEHRRGDAYLPTGATNALDSERTSYEYEFFRGIAVGTHEIKGIPAWVVAQPRLSKIAINEWAREEGFSDEELGRVSEYAVEFFAVSGSLDAVMESSESLPNEDAESTFLGSVELSVPTDDRLHLVIGNKATAAQGFNHLLNEVMLHAGLSAGVPVTS